LAASAVHLQVLPARAQQDPFRDHSRVPNMHELGTVTEFEAVAFAKMPRELFMYMAHGGEGESHCGAIAKPTIGWNWFPKAWWM